MKKKILVALMALTLVASMALVSCDLASIDSSLDEIIDDINSGDTAEVEEKVLEKLNDMTPYEVYSSFDKELDMNIKDCTITTSSKTESSVTIMNQSVTSVTDVNMVVKTKKDNMYSKTTTVTNASGTSVELVIETYYVDGVLYTTDGNYKIKIALSEDEAREIVYGEAAGENSIMDIPESWFEGVCFERQKDGNFVMKLNMSGDRMEEAIDRLGLSADVGLEISDIKYQYKLDKTGMILGCEANYTMEMADTSSSLYTGSAEGTISTTYSDMGSTEEIKAPADADTYTVVTLEDLKAAIGQ